MQRLSMWIGLATGSGATIGSCPGTLRDTWAPGLVAGLHDDDLTSPCGFAAHQAISTPFHPFSVLADDLSLCVFVAFLSKLGQRFWGFSKLGQRFWGFSKLGQRFWGFSKLGQRCWGFSKLGQPFWGFSKLGQRFWGFSKLGQRFWGLSKLGQRFWGFSKLGQRFWGFWVLEVLSDGLVPNFLNIDTGGWCNHEKDEQLDGEENHWESLDKLGCLFWKQVLDLVFLLLSQNGYGICWAPKIKHNARTENWIPSGNQKWLAGKSSRICVLLFPSSMPSQFADLPTMFDGTICCQINTQDRLPMFANDCGSKQICILHRLHSLAKNDQSPSFPYLDPNIPWCSLPTLLSSLGFSKWVGWNINI